MRLFGLNISKAKTSKRHYEAAQSDRFTDKHFVYANQQSADAVIQADLATLRNRVRYEIRNNGLLAGIIQTLASDVVSSGPRLQVGNDDGIEDRWFKWAQSCDYLGRCDLSGLLRLVIYQLCECGEAFVQRVVSKKEIKYVLVEPDRIASPAGKQAVAGNTLYEGIECDKYGRVIGYWVMNSFPGESSNFTDNYTFVKAEDMYHIYRVDRPGQRRGVPWVTQTLTTFGELRDYTKSVLKAARMAANITGVIKTNSAETYDENSLNPESYTTVDLPENSLMALPELWDITQLRAEQPTLMYDTFFKTKVNEAARILHMPLNIALCNSSGYNYSSGQLDHQTYFRFIDSVRGEIERLLNWMYHAFSGIDILENGGENISPRWYWRNRGHADPTKIESSRETGLANRTMSLSRIYAEEGLDWERELKQMAKEKKLIKSLGLEEEPEFKPGFMQGKPDEQDGKQDDKEGSDGKPDSDKNGKISS